MSTMTGKLSPGKSFGAIEDDASLSLKMFALLVGLGTAVVLLEMAFRMPLKLPGHHGLEAMTLMVFGRLWSGQRWAATLIGASAATTALMLGAGHGAMMPIFYLLPGMIFDLSLRFAPGVRQIMILLPLIGGLAWASRPLVRWLAAQGFDLQFGSLSNGLAWPVFSHLLFGTIGAAIAVIGWRQWSRRDRKTA